MKKTLIALGLLALASPALANAPTTPPTKSEPPLMNKNMCAGVVSSANGKLITGAMDMYWNYTDIRVEVGTNKVAFKVSNVKGRMGETDMAVDAEGEGGAVIHFVLPLDGMQSRQTPDTVFVRFPDDTRFIGVCVPTK